MVIFKEKRNVPFYFNCSSYVYFVNYDYQLSMKVNIGSKHYEYFELERLWKKFYLLFLVYYFEWESHWNIEIGSWSRCSFEVRGLMIFRGKRSSNIHFNYLFLIKRFWILLVCSSRVLIQSRVIIDFAHIFISLSFCGFISDVVTPMPGGICNTPR